MYAAVYDAVRCLNTMDDQYILTQPSIKSELKKTFLWHLISKWLTHKLERHKLLLHNACSAFKIERVLLSLSPSGT